MAVSDLFDIWASPSKIPTKTSFTSSDIEIPALSAGDNRLIPFVERIAKKNKTS